MATTVHCRALMGAAGMRPSSWSKLCGARAKAVTANSFSASAVRSDAQPEPAAANELLPHEQGLKIDIKTEIPGTVP